MNRTFSSLQFNLANAPIRYEVLQGREYVVAPVAMLTEGVHNGSAGPLLYRADEIKRAVPAWNMKPIVVYHPSRNGSGISAADPDVLNKQAVGHIMNTSWRGGKLRAEAWIDKKLAAKIDNRVLDALENNKPMEVSTGLYTENVAPDVATEAVFNGAAYTAEAVAHQPDHLALLPDQVGACSLKDGAGLLTINEAAEGDANAERAMARGINELRRGVGNALSSATVGGKLGAIMRERLGSPCYVVDVYPKFFIYEYNEASPKEYSGMKLYKLGYSVTQDEVTVANEPPVEVVRVTEYRTLGEDRYVGNSNGADAKEKTRMNRTELVAKITANLGLGEADRAWLEKLDDAALGKLAGSGKSEPTQNKQTEAEYIANAPEALRAVFNRALARDRAERDALIATITANKTNKFTPEFLATKPTEELEGLAALCAPVANAQTPPQMYFGQAIPPKAPVTNTGGDDDVLPRPEWK